MEDIKFTIEVGKEITMESYKQYGENYFAAVKALKCSSDEKENLILELKMTPQQIIRNSMFEGRIKCSDNQDNPFMISRAKNKQWFLYTMEFSENGTFKPIALRTVRIWNVQSVFRLIRSEMLDPEFIAAVMAESWISKYVDKVDKLLPLYQKHQKLYLKKAADASKSPNLNDEKEKAIVSELFKPVKYAAYSIGRFYILLKGTDDYSDYNYAFLEENFNEVDSGLYQDGFIRSFDNVANILTLELKERFPELKEEEPLKLDYRAIIEKAEEAGYLF